MRAGSLLYCVVETGSLKMQHIGDTALFCRTATGEVLHPSPVRPFVAQLHTTCKLPPLS